MIEVDWHGFHPTNVIGNSLVQKIVLQAWEMGVTSLRIIHGHGRNRGRVPFVNTNTGFLGLTVRKELCCDLSLRPFIKISTLNRSHNGLTTIDLKPNPTPSRTALSADLSAHR
jgi:hypothetical protein